MASTTLIAWRPSLAALQSVTASGAGAGLSNIGAAVARSLIAQLLPVGDAYDSLTQDASLPIASASTSGSTTTITTNTPHALASKQTAVLADASGNRSQWAVTVASTTTFTIQQPGTPIDFNGGEIVYGNAADIQSWIAAMQPIWESIDQAARYLWTVDNGASSPAEVQAGFGIASAGSGIAWKANVQIPSGGVIAPTQPAGFYYVAIGWGSTGATEPTWPTVLGQTVQDGGQVWLCAVPTTSTMQPLPFDPSWATREALQVRLTAAAALAISVDEQSVATQLPATAATLQAPPGSPSLGPAIAAAAASLNAILADVASWQANSAFT